MDQQSLFFPLLYIGLVSDFLVLHPKNTDLALSVRVEHTGHDALKLQIKLILCACYAVVA